MVDGFIAPNRRVALGYDADQAAVPMANISSDGVTLFVAAVAWATDG